MFINPTAVQGSFTEKEMRVQMQIERSYRPTVYLCELLEQLAFAKMLALIRAAFSSLKAREKLALHRACAPIAPTGCLLLIYVCQ